MLVDFGLAQHVDDIRKERDAKEKEKENVRRLYAGDTASVADSVRSLYEMIMMPSSHEA